MPIPVTVPIDASVGGLPRGLMRPLIVQRRREAFDPTDGSSSTVWDAVQILGRIGRGRATEADEQGRQGAITAQTLYTNYPDLRAEDRVLDPDSDEGQPWELTGDPVVVWAADRPHHHEAPIRRSVG